MPSSPILQAWRNTTSPGCARCSLKLQARQAPAQQAGERRLAGLERLAPQVLAVELQQVEGEQEHVRPLGLAAQPLEHREPVVVAGDRLAVDQARAQP